MLRWFWFSLALLTCLNLVGAAPDPYSILPGQGFGKFKAALGLAALEKLTPPGVFGSGEGSAQINMTEPTVRVDVVIDAKGKIKAMAIHGPESKWHTREGITLGTNLQTLEKLNGKAFRFRSFEGERGGEILDWGQGKLSRTLRGVRVTFGSPMQAKGYNTLSGAEKEQIEKPRSYSSSDSLAHRLNPTVETISLEF